MNQVLEQYNLEFIRCSQELHDDISELFKKSCLGGYLVILKWTAKVEGN